MNRWSSRLSIRIAVVACSAMCVACGTRQAENPPAADTTQSAPATTTEPATNAAPPPAPTGSAPAGEPVRPPAAAQAKPPAPKRPAATETKPAPAPQRAPEPVVKTVAAGTTVDLETIDPLSSKTSKAGDVVRARVVNAVSVDGVVAIPAGTIVQGTVTEATPLNKIGGQAKVIVAFDTIELPGGNRSALKSGFTWAGKSETGKDAGTIAGSTAAGALAGRLLSKHDKTKGTLIGAAVGAAVGTGVAAGTKGQEVEVAAGTALTIQLAEPAQVSVRL